MENNRRKTVVRWLRAGTVLAVVGLTNATAQDDPLWRKAVDVAKVGRNLVPGTVDVRFEDLAPDGSGKCVSETTLHFGRRDDGGVAVDEVRSGSLDDKKSAETCGSDWNKETKVSLPFAGDSPFLPWGAKLTEIRALGEAREIDGRSCSVYSFRWKRKSPSKNLMLGTTCLDPSSRTPVTLQYSPAKLPKHFVIESTTIHYADDGEIGWRAVEIEQEFKEDGTPGRTGWARLRAVLKEHWLWTPPPEWESGTDR